MPSIIDASAGVAASVDRSPAAGIIQDDRPTPTNPAPIPPLPPIGMPVDRGCLLVRDRIVVNDALAEEIRAEIEHRGVEPGTRLTLIAREMTHDPNYQFRIEGYPLLLVADVYDAKGGSIDTSGSAGANGSAGGRGATGWAAQNSGKDGGPGGAGQAGKPGAAASPITLLARKIVKARLVARGGSGGAGGRGGDGGAGGNGRLDRPGKFDAFEGTDGGAGGRGGNGGSGGAGARITVHYTTIVHPLQLDGSGGAPGPRGAGGEGGAGGLHGGHTGPDGSPGTNGTPGATVAPTSQARGESAWWETTAATLSLAAASEWANHRTRVGEYLFRTGDRPRALAELQSALRLAPGHATARRLARYVTANHTPIGVAYDHDLVPDFSRYEDVVTDYGPMIQSLLSVASTVLLEASQVSTNRDRLRAELDHVEGVQAALVTDVVGANAGVSHAKGEIELIDKRIDHVQELIAAAEEAMRQQQMDEFDVLGTVWDVAVAVVAVVGAVYTGGATLGALAAAGGFLTNAENVLHAGLWDEKTGTFNGKFLLEFKDTEEFKQMVGGFEELVKHGKSFYDKAEVVAELFNAKVEGETTNPNKELIHQLAELTFERNLLELKRVQADLAYEATVQRKATADKDRASLSTQIDNLTGNVATLSRIARTLIRNAQVYVDLYTRYAFLAARALELWTLRSQTASFSFALGYVHPDKEAHAFMAAGRGDGSRLLSLLEEYVPSITDLPAPIHLRDSYETYTSQLSTFRQYWNISDPDVLASLRDTGATDVRIPLDTIAETRSELKVEQLYVSLVGAAATNATVMVEVEHSGHAQNRRLARGSTVVVGTPAPPRRSTVAASLDENLVEIEDQQQFWGRSPAALWRLTIDESRTPGVDLSGLQELQLVIDYRYLPVV